MKKVLFSFILGIFTRDILSYLVQEYLEYDLISKI